MCFLFAFALAKKVSELCDLFLHVCHLQGWRSSSFSYLVDFVAKTQNPSVLDPWFDEFTIPALDIFMGGDRDELLLCPIKAFRKYLARMEQYCPGISGIFVSTSQKKNRVS